MPRVKRQKLSEEERLAAIAAETSKIVRLVMVRQDIPFLIDLAGMIGIANTTLSAKLKTGSWTQKDICKLVSVLSIPSEEAARMLGVGL